MGRYFSVSPNKLAEMFKYIESQDLPTLMVIQKENATDGVSAACVVSSAWSKSYLKIANPYGKVHRDYHYQVLFLAMATLVEVGCDQIRIEDLRGGLPWRPDAYICLREALVNVRALCSQNLKISLIESYLNSRVMNGLDHKLSNYNFESHRPIGMNLSIENGLNIRKIFLHPTFSE
jgi:hypothetical protein